MVAKGVDTATVARRAQPGDGSLQNCNGCMRVRMGLLQNLGHLSLAKIVAKLLCWEQVQMLRFTALIY